MGDALGHKRRYFKVIYVTGTSNNGFFLENGAKTNKFITSFLALCKVAKMNKEGKRKIADSVL